MLVNQRSILNLKIITDLLALNGSFILAASLAQSFELLLARPNLFVLLILLNVLWYISSRFNNLYDEFSITTLFDQFVAVFKNIAVQGVFTVVFLFFVKEFLFTRYFIIYYALALGITVSAKMLLIVYFFRTARKKGKHLRKLVIAGSGDAGIRFKEALVSNPELGYDFAGFIGYGEETGEKYLGNLDRFDELTSEHKITDAVIAIPPRQYGDLENIVRICDRKAIKTFIIPDYFGFLSSRYQINVMDNIPIITVRNNPLDEAQWRIVKRTFDLFVSVSVILFLAWWLIPVLAFLVKRDSEGKAFFIQERLGRNNEYFGCLKFRTMTTEASSDKKSNRPVEQEDKRITGIGKFLRKYNLDEFPQFINVLKGDMSIVGPRPHAIPFNESYGEIVEEIKLRHRVKPGITGWAQIHGLRGDVIDLEEHKIRTKKRIDYDIWYIENWSFWLDIKIMIETFLQVVSNKNPGN